MADLEQEKSTSTNTSVLERTQTQENPELTDNGDSDRFSHYVSADRMLESRITGRPVVALCGKVWVPQYDRNPDDYPVCPECLRIYNEMSD
ncbi:MAG: DUF3039 domain-containing protein [Bifidobacteriaceae bacterium]|nr:DUF3039 domain-containing protein [Bifidobacteriaceae bacterium]